MGWGKTHYFIVLDETRKILIRVTSGDYLKKLEDEYGCVYLMTVEGCPWQSDRDGDDAHRKPYYCMSFAEYKRRLKVEQTTRSNR